MSSIAHYSSSLYPIFFFFLIYNIRYSSVTNFPNPEGSLLSVWEGIGAVLSSKSREPNVIHARVNTDNACSYKSKNLVHTYCGSPVTAACTSGGKKQKTWEERNRTLLTS